jgi:Holliday junction resolvase
MTNYEKGARAEREAIQILDWMGYDCTRSAGSKGIWDIIAVHPTHVRFIQVKVEGAMTPQELEKIKLYTTPWKCSKEVWTRVPDKPIADRWHVEVYK